MYVSILESGLQFGDGLERVWEGSNSLNEDQTFDYEI